MAEQDELGHFSKEPKFVLFLLLGKRPYHGRLQNFEVSLKFKIAPDLKVSKGQVVHKSRPPR